MAEPYQVRVLQQRVDGDTPEGTDWVLQGIYKKHSQDLEKQCYDYFNQGRDTHRLHFHTGKHDTCDVHLKPKLWDEGLYYQSNLLENGVMQVIPHFIKRAVCNGAPVKRVASPVATPASPPSSPCQAKKAKVVDCSPRMVDATPVVDLTSEILSNHELPDLEETEEDEEEEKEEQEQEQEQDEHELDTPEETVYNITFHPASWPPLPPSTNARQWKLDFEAAKARIQKSRGVIEIVASKHAHVELIQGKYGMLAPKPCETSERSKREDRIYHPQCYEWIRERQHWKSTLGWRCEGCRINHGRQNDWTSRACTVRWVAKRGEAGYSANAYFVAQIGY